MSKKQTIVFDIETMKSITVTAQEILGSQMTMLSNSTQGISPFQGYKPGEMVLWTSGVRSGKSTIGNNMMMTMLKNRKYMEEEKSKYKFSRNWFTVSLGKMDWKKVIDCINWCEETFGPQPKNPDAWSRWQIKYSSIYFRDSKDYEWFMLRWS